MVSDALVGVFNRLVKGRCSRTRTCQPECGLRVERAPRPSESFGVWISGAATVTGMGLEQLVTVTATQGVLPTLGVPAHIGRWFSDEDDTPGSPETVILSYGYWQRRFGGDPQVLGRAIVIDFVPHQVIGVMPRPTRRCRA